VKLPDSMMSSLHDAQAWCASLGESTTMDSYWAEALRPTRAPVRRPWAERLGPNDSYAVIDRSWDLDDELVREVVETRHLLVSGSASTAGRLLGYLPDENLADGAAEDSSEGFFDLNNMPPWGTWVGLAPKEVRMYVDKGVPYRVLIAWVPRELVELAKRGIAVNPEDCIFWLD
jgi:hypothetical protein